ncbi:hybrid sensor histidine kinase/response regulator [Vibrio sp. JC009]|uniref:ATP-binding response regulator n=1 Tax=Vibrio sp. JC009 TaxID=2912314 RepID=UPI0023AED4C8|nr:hybrid sensor histidine kinase/response regulator [Vibrio sp. JC009]WED22897.1 hybrid sensor histidine kinase/response regulator [Vibrio sp. JC009]
MEAQNTHVLVVDDMEAIRKITAEQLTRIGINANNITQAENGQHALEILNRSQVDIILSDWNMPVMSGMELLDKIKSNPEWAKIPFIMLTAESQRSKIAEVIQSGVTDLIIKPFTVQTLRDRFKEAMSGKVRNRTKPPAPKQLAEKTKAPENREEEKPEQTVLVVDDTPENLKLMAGLLRKHYRIQLAKDGPKALSMVQSDSPPDLVLLDVMMPGMNGFEVLEKMRSHPTSENIPVIFVTALTDTKHAEQGLRGGAIDYITKPVDPEMLLLRVNNLMGMVALKKNLQIDIDNMLSMQRMKDDVDQMLHHDLKGPISGIMAISEELTTDNRLPVKTQEMLASIQNLSSQMNNMVNLSADIFKIESGQYEQTPDTYSVIELLKNLCLSSKETFRHKRLMVYLEHFADESDTLDLTAAGDESLTYSALSNLIKNACEASPDNSRIAVHVKQENRNIEISIQNYGVVPQEIRQTFWNKYVTCGKEAGTGLGTYSAKLLIEAQNGRIDLDVDDIAETTKITVSLPAA